MHVDVLIVTAMEKERKAVLQCLRDEQVFNSVVGSAGLKKQREWPFSGYGLHEYDIVEIDINDKTPLRVAVSPSMGKGPLASALSTSKFLSDVVPRLVILCGIAGCMKEQDSGIELGDIGFCQQVYDISAGKFQNGKIDGDWAAISCNPELCSTIEDSLSRSLKPGDDASPRIHYGTFLCSPFVLADAKYKKKLVEQTQNRNLIGIEMESSGVFSACLRSGVQYFLMIKGFSDFAGIEKATQVSASNEKERLAQKDILQKDTALNAASVLLRVLACIADRRVKLLFSESPSQHFDRRVEGMARCLTHDVTNAPKFWPDYCETMSQAFRAEIADLHHFIDHRRDDFEVSIDSSSQFLMRASSLYRQTCSISAVSIDSVSKFWLSPETRNLTNLFVDSQSHLSDGATIRQEAAEPSESEFDADLCQMPLFRLFVFKDPESAHRHCRRLDYHALKFDNTMVCSFEHYEKIASRWANSGLGIEDLSSKDFAIVDFEDKDLYFSTLREHSISLRRMLKSPIDPIQLNVFQEFVHDCREVKKGEHKEIFGVPVLKWKSNLWEPVSNPGKWASALKTLFPSTVSDTFHLFGFSTYVDCTFPRFRQWLIGLKAQAKHSALSRSIAGQARVKSVSLTTRFRPAVPERLLVPGGDDPGDLKDRNENLVAIRFRDDRDLALWYTDKNQIHARAGLYLELIESSKSVQDLVEKSALKTVKYQSIEDIVSIIECPDRNALLEGLFKVWRKDFRDDEMIDQLAVSEPATF